MRRSARIGVLLGVLALPGSAAANPETPYLSDGRSVAMGGVGVASNDYASSAWQNPAGISSVHTLSLTGTLLPLANRVDAPFPDPVTGQPNQVGGAWQFGSLGTLAGAYRLHERVAAGLTTYVFSGSGNSFRDVVGGEDVEAFAFAGELQLPIAVTITEALRVGVAYRITFARVGITLPVPAPPPSTVFGEAQTDLLGFDFAGLALGVRYRATERLVLGLTYRNEVVVDLDGDTETNFAGQEQKVDSEGEYALPHTLKLGSELDLLEGELVLALDLSYYRFQASHPRDVTAGRPSAWNDSLRGALGAEYWLKPRVALRAGVHVANSATSDQAASQLGVPPGIIYGLSVGAGVTLGELALDFALAYTGTRENVAVSANPGATGPYAGNSVFLCASLNYERAPR